MTECSKFRPLHDLKIQDGGQMHYGHAEMTQDQNSKPEPFLRDVIIMMNKDVYIKRMSGT